MLTLAAISFLACGPTPVGTVTPAPSSPSNSSSSQPNVNNSADQNNTNPPNSNSSSTTNTQPNNPSANIYISEFNQNHQTDLIKKQISIDDYFWGYFQLAGGSVKSGMSDVQANDNFVAQLVFPGDPLKSGSENTGPGEFGTHLESDLESQNYSFGTYRIRFKAPTCLKSDEGIISGLFTYLNDGQDLNANGIIDNSEIDIEVSCNEPSTLYLSIWTDYTDDSSFIKNTRRIDLNDGTYEETKPGQEGKYGLGISGSLPFSFPTLDLRSDYHEIEMIWTPSSVSYYLLQDGAKYLLWDFQRSEYIPLRSASYLMNIWHSKTLWNNDNPAEYPDNDVTLSIDSFEYQPLL